MTEPDERSQAGSSRRGQIGDLSLRVASAAVLVPAVLAITYFGGRAFLLLCLVAAGGVLWEWMALVAHRADPRFLAPGWAALVAAVVLIGSNLQTWTWIPIAAGSLIAGAAVVLSQRRGSAIAAVWAMAGVIYAGAGMLGPALLRLDPEWGLTALLFLYATVWGTDVFAYFCGRAIGGPRLWPKVSPMKTWSGAVGGLAGGVAAGIAVAYANGMAELGIIGAMALLLSALAQAGDLLESAVKRHFGAKDTSRLIPGHGGLMDRLDSFLVAAFAALLIGILHPGTATPARGLLLW